MKKLPEKMGSLVQLQKNATTRSVARNELTKEQLDKLWGLFDEILKVVNENEAIPRYIAQGRERAFA